jgi:hypothetical protein
MTMHWNGWLRMWTRPLSSSSSEVPRVVSNGPFSEISFSEGGGGCKES